MSKAQWNNSRKVTERIFIEGVLTLETPAHFGSGDGDRFSNMPLLYDPADGRTPLLTGASIAGALRNYLREYEHGFGWAEDPGAKNKSLAEKLFGSLSDHTPGTNKNNPATLQSWLMIDDAPGNLPTDALPEIRDGVSIDPQSRTAKEGKKFDIELLPAGTTFTLRFELWLNRANRESLLKGLAIALRGLQKGKIGLGMRKRRGYGQCAASNWRVRRYRMDNIREVLAWLENRPDDRPANDDILAALFDKAPALPPHQGKTFRLNAVFYLDSSLLIRSASGSAGVDSVHLRSWRSGEEKPVVSGTSLAGVIRHRALRIANTLKSDESARTLINGMFGNEMEGNRRASGEKEGTGGSRVWVAETEIKEPIANLVQNRVKIDRFTGGAYPGALFSQQPVFPNAKTKIEINLELRKGVHTETERFHAEIGLLLLTLKDLWTGDLPVGGESSVGRGRLRGKKAVLTLEDTEWILEEAAQGELKFTGNGAPDLLETRFLTAFKAWGKGKEE